MPQKQSNLFMLKRILISFLLSIVTLSAYAKLITYDTVNGFTLIFRVISEDERTCETYDVKKSDSNVDLKIPESVSDGVNTYKVTSIGNRTFYECSQLTSILIPNSIISIGEDAFYGCKRLTSLLIPASVIEISSNAFVKCEKLNKIAVNGQNKHYSSIDGVLFNKDITTIITFPIANSTTYTIPNTVTKIGDYAFSYCSNLLSINLPNTITEIGDYAFSGCMNLTSIDIPNTIIKIGNYAFDNCTTLTSINIPNTLSKISNGTFSYCRALTSINIPNSITEIGDYAFWACNSLQSIIIPSFVVAIGTDAFSWCAIKKAAYPLDLENPFVFNYNATLIQYDRQNAYIDNDFVYSRNMEEIYYAPLNLADTYIMPKNVTIVGAKAFSNCEKLRTLVLSPALTKIGEKAWCDCPNIKSIYSLATEPAEAPIDAFMTSILNNAILFVPNGCLDIYESIDPWCYFYNISEGEYDSINDLIVNENIEIDLSKPYNVYDINGKIAGHSLTSLLHGVYVIMQGNNKQKIVIK